MPFLPVALFVTLAIVFLRGWVLGGPADPADPSAGDLLSQYYPLFRYGFGEIAAGRIPLWNPHQLAGVPFLAFPVASFVYPVYLPFLFLPTEIAMNVDLVVHLAICGASTYFLCRALGLGPAASILAGIVYSYQGGMMIKVYYPGYLASVAWMPLFFLFSHRLIAGSSGPAGAGPGRPSIGAALWLAIVFGLSLLGGHGVQFTYFEGLALLPFIAALALERARAEGARAAAVGIAFVGLGFALGALLASVRLVPAAEVARLSWRPPGGLSFDDAATMSVSPKIFLDNLLSPATILGAFMAPRHSAIMREGYVGIVPLALALVGAFCWRGRMHAWPLAAAGIGAVLYAFGVNGWLFPILYRLPGGAWFRGPDRALFVFGFAVAVLAGAGFDELLGREGGRRGWIAGALAGAAVLVAAWARGTNGHAMLIVVFYCAATAAVAVLARTMAGDARRAPTVSALALLILGALALVDLWNGLPLGGAMPSRAKAYFARHDALFAAIRERQGLARTYVWASFRPRDPLYLFSDIAKAGLFHGVYLPTDYEGLVQHRIDRYLRFEAPGVVRERGPLAPIGYYAVNLTPANAPLFDLLGVRFFVLGDGMEKRYIDPALDIGRRWRLLRRADGVTLYENPQAMPRVFVTPRVEVVADADAVLDRLATADLRDVAFVEEPFEAIEAAGDASAGVNGDAPLEASIVEYEANRVQIEASAPRGGLLVLTDQDFPGWRASLDGAPVDIRRADYLFRGVRLPPGRHRVDLLYRPASVAIGLAGTGFAAVLMAALAIGAALAKNEPSSDKGGAKETRA